MLHNFSSVESRNENGLGDYQDLQNKMLIVNKTVQGIKSLDESQAIQISKKLSHMTERVTRIDHLKTFHDFSCYTDRFGWLNSANTGC